MEWVYNELCKNKKARQRLKKGNYISVTSRSERLLLWAYILKNTKVTHSKHYAKALNNVCRYLISSNDNYIRDFKFESEFSTVMFNLYRDNYQMQFYRASKIFIESNTFEICKTEFNEKYGFSLNEYIWEVNEIIKRIYEIKEIDYYRPYELFMWVLSYNTPNSLSERILETVSLSQEQFNDKLDNINYSRDFSLFQNNPFLKLPSGSFLPIDGKFVEDLLFYNLFYKLESLPSKSKFITEFGYAFEMYISGLIEKSINYNSNLIHIPEFAYKQGTKKSPDAIIYNKNEDGMLVIECKSARVLNTLITRDDKNESFDKTLEKLRIRPWKQMYKSICSIIKENAHPLITQGKKYMFLCVTMNDLPMYPINFSIDVDNKHIEHALFSMNVEAFEIFLEILSMSGENGYSHILLGYRKYQNSMSMKTYLNRIRKNHNLNNKKFIHEIFKDMNNIWFP